MIVSRTIDPIADLGSYLLSVEKPARYVGGEYGSIRKDDAVFSFAIAFPDLYEIGMSNQALRIIYNGLNKLEGVSCERVFAPAPDFESVLAEANIPLYTLERGVPLSDLDMLGITMGYELGITGALSILQAGGIPIRRADRRADDPIVIMGGPAVSNPEPFSRFIDAAWIGEAEAGFFDLVAELRDLRRKGAGRDALLERMAEEDAIWMPGKKARRAVYARFAEDAKEGDVFPVASMRIVQDHGSVEIMRGCPNGCRFCHAGLWYRPMRQKSESQIAAEVESFVRRGGYREITLASLSSGDYSGIENLIHDLNTKYGARRVSFQLPSLKVSSFSLPLLERLSEVRKSGLTFAVETPVDAWQLAINKDVTREGVVSILREAKSRGWRSAKFYFMIGLPVEDDTHRSEEEEIVEFLLDVSRKSSVHINVNVGTFVPKPHTPYQWAEQLSEEKAAQKLGYIRNELKRGNFKVGTHDPFTSTLEGIISRGDERIGELIDAAFLAGCRLDAWDDYIKRDTWRGLLQDRSDVVSAALSSRDPREKLPWQDVESGISMGYLKRENQRSQSRTSTSICIEECTLPCGVCSSQVSLVRNSAQIDSVPLPDAVVKKVTDEKPRLERSHDIHAPSLRIVFTFTKSGSAVFVPHLGVIEVFSKAFVRSGLPVKYSEGFNPLPKLNFAAPLSVGIIADAEVALVEMSDAVSTEEFIASFNDALPQGFRVVSAYGFRIPEGIKKVSAASILWGFSYLVDDGREVLVPAEQEKQFRLSRLGDDANTRTYLRRVDVRAKIERSSSSQSYFEAYARLYEKYGEDILV